MIGVVIWGDSSEGQAVVWCEDHGDLAFLGGDEASPERLGYFVAGDVLEFDVEVDGNLRRVNNPVLSQGIAAGGLDSKRETATTCLGSRTREKIILFPRPSSAERKSDIPAERAM